MYFIVNQFHTIKIPRGGAAAARVAHNHEVIGSSPVPATKKKSSGLSWAFVFVIEQSWTVHCDS